MDVGIGLPTTIPDTEGKNAGGVGAAGRSARPWWPGSVLVIYVAGVSVGYLLMVTNGIFQDDPASQLDLLMSFITFMVVFGRPG